jgi:predicted cobalt transporter CbtA
MTLAALLRRGILAGLLAGVLAGLFGLLVAEPTIDRAIALEDQRAAATADTSAGHTHAGNGTDSHHTEVFSRDTQRAGLLVGTAVTGTALGALFALAYAGIRRRTAGPDARPWTVALLLAAGGFAAVYAIPFLRYPANPPGVGDPESIGTRTGLWLGAIVIGLATVTLAVIAHRRLAGRGAARPVQDLAAGGVVVLGLVALFLLPSDADPGETDAGLLWTFRMLSVATQVVLWGALGVTFGLLAERATPASSRTPESSSSRASRTPPRSR